MSEAGLRLYDFGTSIVLTVKDDGNIVDLSGASTKEIILKKPTGTRLLRTASFVTDGTDGQIYYTLVSGELDTAGTWRLQGLIAMSGGIWRSDVHQIKVEKILEI